MQNLMHSRFDLFQAHKVTLIWLNFHRSLQYLRISANVMARNSFVEIPLILWIALGAIVHWLEIVEEDIIKVT